MNKPKNDLEMEEELGLSKRLDYNQIDQELDDSFMSLELKESDLNSNLDNFLLNHPNLLNSSENN